MDRRFTPSTFPFTRNSRLSSGSIFLSLALMLGLSMGTLAAAQERVVITLAGGAGKVEKLAAEELVSHLHRLYPSTKFEVGAPGAGSPVIYLGTAQDLPTRFASQLSGKLINPESFVITVNASHEVREAVVAGASPRATLFAVDALLEKLGFGFYLSYNTTPSPSHSPFSFAGWEMSDAPIVGERVIFDWHNFLSGCSTWNLQDWQNWVTQASRMRFNTVMVHAYGNNPMVSFSLNGETKPTGYLPNTRVGRDWGTQHVIDVRKIVGAEGLFNGPVFGADASMVPDNERVSATTSLMQDVFRFAANRGMGVTFALDVDTESANPQDVIKTLPASARFEHRGLQLVDPDTADGYVYYRAEIEQLMKLYPQITQLAVWFRGGLNSPWRELQPDEFPAPWRDEYRAALEANPRLNGDPEAPSMFAIGKVAKAFRKALDETGHNSVTISAGSWRFTYLPSADVFMPATVALMPLDYSYEFLSDPVQESLRLIGRHRPTVPIVWAQHDDREYAGRSYTPFAGFGSLLRSIQETTRGHKREVHRHFTRLRLQRRGYAPAAHRVREQRPQRASGISGVPAHSGGGDPLHPRMEPGEGLRLHEPGPVLTATAIPQQRRRKRLPRYFTATVTPLVLAKSPIFTITGKASAGANAAGTSTLIWVNPATLPGAAPAYLTTAFTPPMVTTGVCASRNDASAVTAPSALAGAVTPPPVQ